MMSQSHAAAENTDVVMTPASASSSTTTVTSTPLRVTASRVRVSAYAHLNATERRSQYTCAVTEEITEWAMKDLTLRQVAKLQVALLRVPKNLAQLELDASIQLPANKYGKIRDCVLSSLIYFMNAPQMRQKPPEVIDAACTAIEENIMQHPFTLRLDQVVYQYENNAQVRTETSILQYLIEILMAVVQGYDSVDIRQRRMCVCARRCILALLKQPSCTPALMQIHTDPEAEGGMPWVGRVLMTSMTPDVALDPDECFRPTVEYLIEHFSNENDILKSIAVKTEDGSLGTTCILAILVSNVCDIELLLRVLLIELKSGRLSDPKRSFYQPRELPEMFRSKIQQKRVRKKKSVQKLSLHDILAMDFGERGKKCTPIRMAKGIIQHVSEWQKNLHASMAAWPTTATSTVPTQATSTSELQSWLELRLAEAPTALLSNRLMLLERIFNTKQVQAAPSEDTDNVLHNVSAADDSVEPQPMNVEPAVSSDGARMNATTVVLNPFMRALVHTFATQPMAVDLDDVCVRTGIPFFFRVMNLPRRDLILLTSYADAVIAAIARMSQNAILQVESVTEDMVITISLLLQRHMVEPHTDRTDFVYRIFDAILAHYDRHAARLWRARGISLSMTQSLLNLEQFFLSADPSQMTEEFVRQLMKCYASNNIGTKFHSAEGDVTPGLYVMDRTEIDAALTDVHICDEVTQEVQEWYRIMRSWHSSSSSSSHIPRILRVLQRLEASGFKWNHNGTTYADDLIRAVGNKESKVYGQLTLVEDWIAYHRDSTDWLHILNGDNQNWHQLAVSMRHEEALPDGYIPDKAMIERVIALFDVEARAWSDVRWPQIRSEVGSHLLVDLAPIVISYLTPPNGSWTVVTPYECDIRTFRAAKDVYEQNVAKRRISTLMSE